MSYMRNMYQVKNSQQESNAWILREWKQNVKDLQKRKVTSFIKIADDKIAALDEYWADDSDAPQWRLDKHIGTAIK